MKEIIDHKILLNKVSQRAMDLFDSSEETVELRRHL